MNTYTYEFATGNKEIEISEEWMKVLEDLDKGLYNNDHAETSYGDDVEWLALDKTEELFDYIEIRQLIAKAGDTLTDQQFKVLVAISVEGHTYTSCAEKMGMSIKNVRKLYLKAITNLKKYKIIAE